VKGLDRLASKETVPVVLIEALPPSSATLPDPGGISDGIWV
jgi:hypothetical protein